MDVYDKMRKYNVILASKSPRRQYLLKELGINFEIKTKETEEQYPPHLQRDEIAIFLCKLKADAFKDEIENNTLLITADTIVWLNNSILNKPKDYDDAVSILQKLSGEKHEVITAVCLTTKDKQSSFFASSYVYFRELSLKEINYYLDTCKPFDKAGAYGIQEWLGYTGIERIDGSFYNVMGLPTQKLYEELSKF